jgi:hypothetical protein
LRVFPQSGVYRQPYLHLFPLLAKIGAVKPGLLLLLIPLR